MDMIQSLKNFSILKKVSDEELRAFSSCLREEKFDAGENIIREGENGDTMYLLIDGSVDILKTTIYGDEFICASLDSTAHAVFGEMALIDADKRSATVKAKTPCLTYSIHTAEFKTYCKQHPSAGVELLTLISINLVRNLRHENENLRLVYQALIDEIEED